MRVEPRPADDAAIAVAVQDYGPGIAPEHLPRLTERFYRVDVGASREMKGTGLGLAIVKHILTRHQGRLEVKSQPGAGRAISRSSCPSTARSPKRSEKAAIYISSLDCHQTVIAKS